ncbi:MAG TPA: cytochrome c biogenesis protein ResB [Acidobacteriota bacterium]|nr:cytochrome c biogenesis protein ResB [Acidobacteriota bacterium]
MKAVWRFFESVKLAIILIILLALASILGTLIPQGRSAAEYAARYGTLSGLLGKLQLTNLYHSGWFLALLSALALNTVVCTIGRFRPKWRRAIKPSLEVEDKSLQALKFKGRARIQRPLPEAAEGLRRALVSRHYRLKTSAAGPRLTGVAQKRRLGSFGSDTVHLGLLIVLAGAVVSSFTSRRGDLDLRVGQTASVPHAAFQVRLDKFETEYYPGGEVRDWKSTVTVLEKGEAVLTRVVEVNHPLTYEGYSFYQTSYGWDWDDPRLEIEVKKPGDPSYLKTVRAKVGERLAIDDPDFTHLVVRRFVPDFVIGEGNEIQSRSYQPNNPAALIETWKGEEKVYSGWSFAKYPDFGEGHKVGAASYIFILKTYDAPQYSVLEAANDPGVPLIWIGCFVLTAGFVLAFYWHPREIRVVLEENQGRTEAVLGGVASKGREAFQAEFDSLVESLRRSE